MPKRPLPVLTLVSAIVCMGSLGLVGRSVFRIDILGFSIGQKHGFGAATFRGQLVLMGRAPYSPTFYSNGGAAEARPFMDEVWWKSRGFRWLGIGWRASDIKILILPFWLVPILTAILPVRWWRAGRRDGARGFEVEPAATA